MQIFYHQKKRKVKLDSQGRAAANNFAFLR